MCGPACPIECNKPIDKTATGHAHPAARGTFRGAFPLHRMPSLAEGLQQSPEKALTAVDGRRLSSTTVLNRPPTLMDGVLQDEARKAARLLNPSHRVEVERRLEQVAFEMTMYGSGAINQLPEEDVKGSWKAGHYVPPNRRRSVPSTPLVARIPPRNAASLGSNKGSASVENVRASAPTLSSRRSLHQVTSFDGGATTATEGSVNVAPSLRTIPSERAHGKLRIVNASPSVAPSVSRASTVAQTPQRRRYRTVTPVRPSEKRPSSPDANADLTLRHIQRMARNQVEIRLAIIGERCHHFRELSRYEAVDKEVFASFKQLQIMRVMLEKNNRQLGGCAEREEPAWAEFLRLLEKVEGDVERENARLRGSEQKKRLRRETNVESNEVVQEETESCDGSFATAEEAFTIDSIPAVQTGLVRSLSLPARLAASVV